MSVPVYRVWVDETGDRGTGPRASPYFGFAAVVVRAERMDAVKAACEQVNEQLGRAATIELHWSKNLKDHEKRAAAVEAVARLNIRLIYSVIEKSSTPVGSRLDDRDAMYNYPLRLLLERVSWLVHGRSGIARITLASVSGLPKAVPLDYVEKLRARDTTITWRALHPKIEVQQASTRRGLQVADIAAGALDRAMRPAPNPPHRIEPAYLQALAPRIYTRGPGKMGSYGLKCLPGTLCEQFPWWPGVNGQPANV